MQSVIRAAPAAGGSSMGRRCGWEAAGCDALPTSSWKPACFQKAAPSGRAFIHPWSSGSKAPFLRAASAACSLGASKQLDTGLKRGKRKEKGHGEEAAAWCKTVGKKWGRKRNEMRMGHFLLAFIKYLQHSVGQQMNQEKFQSEGGLEAFSEYCL